MIDILDLAIETTRRCNMRCAHCLRGEPQRVKMDPQHLRDFFREIDYVSCITFSGGEPSLPSGMDTIEETLYAAMNSKTCVGSFYIITNGKTLRSRFLDLISRWYDFCEDNEVSGIDVSNDMFHLEEGEPDEYYQRLEDAFYNRGLYNKPPLGYRGDFPWKVVIAEGRGIELGAERENPPHNEFTLEWNDPETPCITEGYVYLNCHGYLIDGCNWSYRTQDSGLYTICHASDNIEENLIKYISKKEMEAA